MIGRESSPRKPANAIQARSLYREGLDDNQRDALDDKTLPPLAEGELLDLRELLPEQRFTEPPSLIRFGMS